MQIRSCIILSFFCAVGVIAQLAIDQNNAIDDLEDRIQSVFGRATNNSIQTNPRRAGFDQIVQPEPIFEPTTMPQMLLTGNGERCTCTEYYNCDPTLNNTARFSDNTIDNFGTIDIRFNPGKCQAVLDVCCPPSQTVQQSIQPAPVITRPNRPSGCGIRNPGGIDFQLAGNTDEAGFAEFPWTVALIRIVDNACLCGGSLIHPQIILTGNHCVRLIPPREIKIRAGEWDTQTTKERLPYQERNVAATISHPNYNSKTLANDIALLMLESPLILNDHINPICLPQRNFVSTGLSCFASGWGKDVFGKAGKYSVIMKRVQLPVVDSRSCENTLQGTRLGPRFRLDPTFICAGGQPGVDTCQGDGGAPLACPVGRVADNRYVQSGIVSWGIGCKEARPAVYADVATFREWIDRQMQILNLGTSSYSF